MRDPSESILKAPPMPRWAIYLTIGQAFLGVLPTLGDMAGWPILASPAWVSLVRIPAWVATVLFALFFIWFFNDRVSRSESRLPAPAKALAYLVGVFLWVSLSRAFVFETIPMAEAALLGRETEFSLVVRYTGSSSRSCRTKIYVNDLPLLSNSICNIAGSFVKTLKPGMRIIVSGRGTPHGLFVNYVRLASDGVE